jgi:hypothetical protein
VNPGDAGRPFRTIGRGVAELQPGDTLTVAAGTYTESVVIQSAGRLDAPITLRGAPGAVIASPRPGTSLSAIDVYGSAAHVVVRDLEITGDFGESVFVRSGAHHIELAGLDIHDNHTGVWIGGASNVVVRDTWIHDNARSGIRLFSGARDVTIVDVRTERHDDGNACLGDADGVSADETTTNIRFVRVQSVGNSEDGFDLAAAGLELHEVQARDNGCSGVKLGASARLENVLITGSRIGLNVRGDSGTSTAISNCTLLDNGIGVRALGDGLQMALQNCVVAGLGKALYVSSTVGLSEHHNIFYRPDADSRLIVRATDAGELLYSAADVNGGLWRTASGGQGEATIAVDPQLDVDGRPVRSASPTVDTGSLVGSPAVDLIGVARPHGQAVDRGAFEHVPPLPDTVRSRVVMRDDAVDSAEIRLSMRVTLPALPPFDVHTDPVQVTLRGSAGVVATVRVDTLGRTRRVAVGSRRRLTYRRRGADRVSMTLGQTDTVVRVRLRVADVQMAAIPDDELWVDIAIGAAHATAHARLRGTVNR